ncbi:MAG: hypothetical protein ACK4SF_01040 [Algoriphagus aquaeductus]|uniref:hypothetical protein n=1 Tax=Algoriphagus aquaeductus TaxID=475299 RepID=UPI00391AA708
MKNFKIYLKAKTTWVFHVIFSLGYFLLVQAYVYPTLSFDFSAAFETKTWFELLFMNSFLLVTQYFWFWKPNQKRD